MSDHAEVARIIQQAIDDVEAAGGYVHPDLEFHCDRSHPHGALRLEGVANDVLSLRVPKGLPSWLAPHIALGREMNKSFYDSHIVEKGVLVPLFDMANHSFDGGTVIYRDDCYELYGTTHCYSRRPDRLKQLGIC